MSDLAILVRPLQPEDAETYRATRLEALERNPDFDEVLMAMFLTQAGAR